MVFAKGIDKIYNIQMLYNAMFFWLGMSTLVIFILTFRRRYVILSPSDFLMLLFPLILVLVPDPFRGQYKTDIIALRSIVMFTATFFLVRRNRAVYSKIRFVMTLSLGLVALIGVLGMRLVNH